MSTSIRNLIFIVTIGIFITVCLHILKNVPVFADGTQHVWLTNYVYENSKLPSYDITGIQPTNLNISQSIRNPRPFVYHPGFYLLSGMITKITKNAELSINLINITVLIIGSFLLFGVVSNLYDQKAATVSFVLFLLSGTNFWMVSHRLVEPIIISLFIAVFYCFTLLNKQKEELKTDLVLAILCVILFFLFSIKQSTIPIIAASLIGLMFFANWKKWIIFLLTFVFLSSPIILFNINQNNSLYSLPLGIKSIDKIFTNAWWNQPNQPWEDQLNLEVSAPQLRKLTYDQFTNIQISPQKLFGKKDYLAIINEFSAYPLSESTEGYQSSISKDLAPFFILLLLLFIFQFPLNKPKISLSTLTFLVSLLLIIFIFWMRQPTFRYYIYIDVISIIIFSKVIGGQANYKSFLTYITLFLIANNIGSEVNRIKDYNFTAMYRQIPGKTGGLNDSITFSNQLNSQTEKSIFTPMVEIAYYSKKPQLWDIRLFFVDGEDKLISYLSHYDFEYIVLPFYSGKKVKADWKYYEGLPADSTLNYILGDDKYFSLVESNSTFSVYKRNF